MLITLELKDIDDKIIKKLESAKYTVGSLAIANINQVMERTDLTHEQAKKVIDAAQDNLGIHPVTASEFLESERRRGKITTNSTELDSMLGGGVSTAEITELAGAFSSGKTQLCFQLCITVQLDREEGGLGGKALFIDTERTFSPQRIVEMASYKELEVKEILDNILVAPAANSHVMFAIIDKLETLIPENNIKLIIIDSFASHFRSEYIGKDKLVERQQKIMSMAEQLTKLAVNYDVAVVVTNQIIAAIDQFLYGSAEEPALGFAWAHRPQQRVFLRKSRGSGRIARLFDSSRNPEREVLFYVTEQGISDSPATMDFF